jgi:alpha-tubulin suppressor-like RCC1 family protein
VFSCGSGEFGQLGLGESLKVVTTPTLIDALQDTFIVSIDAAFNQSVAIAGMSESSSPW